MGAFYSRYFIRAVRCSTLWRGSFDVSYLFWGKESFFFVFFSWLTWYKDYICFHVPVPSPSYSRYYWNAQKRVVLRSFVAHCVRRMHAGHEIHRTCWLFKNNSVVRKAEAFRFNYGWSYRETQTADEMNIKCHVAPLLSSPCLLQLERLHGTRIKCCWILLSLLLLVISWKSLCKVSIILRRNSCGEALRRWAAVLIKKGPCGWSPPLAAWTNLIRKEPIHSRCRYWSPFRGNSQFWKNKRAV